MGKTGSFGGIGGEGTPGSIPNPAVKLPSADGTALVTGWESRSLPTEPVFHAIAGEHGRIDGCARAGGGHNEAPAAERRDLTAPGDGGIMVSWLGAKAPR